MKKYIVILLFLLTFNNANGQGVHSQITIMAGGSVFFPFNSYTKMEAGMEYTNWTKLKILYFEDDGGGALVVGSNWELLVRSMTNDIPGDGGGSMTLDKVELLVLLVNDSGEPLTTPYTITSTDTRIVWNGANPTGTTIGATVGLNTEVWISYRVGNDGTGPPAANAVLGQAPGYYNLDLVFTLKKQ